MRIRNFATLTVAAAMCMSAAGALADTITFEGSVAPSKTCEVYADVGGAALSVDDLIPAKRLRQAVPS